MTQSHLIIKAMPAQIELQRRGRGWLAILNKTIGVAMRCQMGATLVLRLILTGAMVLGDL